MAYATSEIALGTQAPDFALLDTVSGRLFSLRDVAGSKATVIMFTCNHCPYVQHILDKVVEVAKEYQQKGVGFVAISANDATIQPEDRPSEMKALAQERGFTFPYLYDQTQQVARTYQAVCTPEFFAFDANKRLAYHGQFDSSRPKSHILVTGQDLTSALDALLKGQQPSQEQQPAVGCGIKWKHPY
ncbi:thioredoxin family protein [Pontibacter sp. BT310]|uniref:Thioredoxin family protein n=1 Tax=Pontibacter populi TaxID=890055 RepID=A0ABS6X7M0_9BACT|nr:MULTISPECIES: thioredoxin family protein [Pontibacter]MBJ6116644.1 thioredoxin family protein [Pontibacter sp. BT310]MBR0569068.1 thioredoxin family protein [Microvirga sp. STS03]MBW3363498.1 thioredoxin family protein [Pontibacter populi]